MAKKNHYDDAFRDIMHYAELELRQDGKMIRIRDRDDLKRLFKLIDKNRRDQKGRPRFSEEFIDKATSGASADHYLGKTVGSSTAKESTFKRERQPTIQELERRQKLKLEGRAVYRYPRGFAMKRTIKRGDDIIIRFEDIMTGKPVKSKELREDE